MTTEQDAGFKVALAAYVDAGRPRICPCCGSWDGPSLPMCTDAGWTHAESCRLTRYSANLCDECEAEMA